MREDTGEGNSKMERKKIWEAYQGNPASQICSCGIKIGIKKRKKETPEQKYTSHFTSLLKGANGEGGDGGGWLCCHFMLALIPQAQRGKQPFSSLHSV